MSGSADPSVTSPMINTAVEGLTRTAVSPVVWCGSRSKTILSEYLRWRISRFTALDEGKRSYFRSRRPPSAGFKVSLKGPKAAFTGLIDKYRIQVVR